MNLIFHIFPLLSLIIALTYSHPESPEVLTSYGKLKGVYLKSTKGRIFSAFMSIPFAKPPIGELRFKAPVDALSWTGVRDATIDSPICIQNNPYTRERNVQGSEDCLYLNVYTPEINDIKESLLPVMVFFHGGGWMCGSGNKLFYGPERLMDKDVVYVGVNYRLGILGTFSTEDEVSPGNYVLKDQNMALKWIQRNIKSFGGDPNSVTIFGESAGGASVHYHMLSPKSKGLFHKAISHSGTALCVWANAVPNITTKRRNTFSKSMNCPHENSTELVECLRKKSAEEIISADIHLYDWDYDPMIPFRPIVEIEHEEAFLTRDPRKLIIEGKFHQVPWILGMNAKEGALRAANILGNSELCHELESNFDTLAPITFEYQYSDKTKHITEEIKKFYFNNNVNFCNGSANALTDVYTDSIFLSGIDETIKLHLDQAREPMYFYYFDFKGQNSFTKVFGDPITDYGGACHVDELIYLFNLGLFDNSFDHREESVSSQLLTLWSNFATSGNPNKPSLVQGDSWMPIKSTENLEYLQISTFLSMENNLLNERRKFWNNMPLWQKISSNYYNHVHGEL